MTFQKFKKGFAETSNKQASTWALLMWHSMHQKMKSGVKSNVKQLAIKPTVFCSHLTFRNLIIRFKDRPCSSQNSIRLIVRKDSKYQLIFEWSFHRYPKWKIPGDGEWSSTQTLARNLHSLSSDFEKLKVQHWKSIVYLKNYPFFPLH